MSTAVSVQSLLVQLTRSGADIVDDITFSISRGEILGLAGESGSGKTTIGAALLGHARRGTRIAAGRVVIDGADMLALDGEPLRRARGRLVAYVPQDPAATLNPAARIGQQLGELFDFHDAACPRADRAERIRAGLEEVGLPADRTFLRRWPHQLSGGQQQRVCLAMAFLLRPRVIVLDEPTTGLDVTTQARVLAVIRELCGTRHAAALFITHDLAVVSALADQVMVIYGGRLAEAAPRRRLFTGAVHPYTAGLLASIPEIAERRRLQAIPGRPPAPDSRPQGCLFAPRCPVRLERCATEVPPVTEVTAGHQARCHRAGELTHHITAEPAPPPGAVDSTAPLLAIRNVDVGYKGQRVVRNADLAVYPGECVALVGESGSGKTTLSRAIAGLAAPAAGRIELAGRPLAGRVADRPAHQRRAIGYVFQNPYRSLNPRHPIGEIVGAPLRQLSGVSRSESWRQAEAALEQVGLDPVLAGRRPGELSGGERQRVAIARALACRPDILICDEITSALDVSVQAAILSLLEQLRTDHHLAMLLITHNLAVVRTLANRVAVLHNGTLVEQANTDDLLDHPATPYTAELIRNTPTLAPIAAGVPSGLSGAIQAQRPAREDSCPASSRTARPDGPG
jgi:peptide/nickel transport system ATP-binding protein